MSEDGLRIDPAWRRSTVVGRLIAALPESRFVGGCVRDAFLGLEATDIDIATPLAPEAVMTRAAAAGFKTVPTGLKHGTVTVIVDHQPFQVTTLRRDVATDGRHATVEFTDDWQADAARRDFTMNALYAASDGTVYDPFEGVADLRAGRVRFVGDPATRIKEDALRILRFFRFHARLGQGDADAAGLAACADAAAALDGLSRERVRDELLKILGAVDPLPVLAMMQRADILGRIVDGADLPAVGRLVRRENAVDIADPLRRLRAVDTRSADDLATDFRLATKDRDRLAGMAGEPPDGADDKSLRACCYRDGVTATVDRMFLAASTDTDTLIAVRRFADHWEKPVLPVRGADLLALGWEAGPGVGEIVGDLETRWIDSDFALTREQLLALAEKVDH